MLASFCNETRPVALLRLFSFVFESIREREGSRESERNVEIDLPMPARAARTTTEECERAVPDAQAARRVRRARRPMLQAVASVLT